jgi:hypothetical protein
MKMDIINTDEYKCLCDGKPVTLTIVEGDTIDWIGQGTRVTSCAWDMFCRNKDDDDSSIILHTNNNVYEFKFSNRGDKERVVRSIKETTKNNLVNNIRALRTKVDGLLAEKWKLYENAYRVLRRCAVAEEWTMFQSTLDECERDILYEFSNMAMDLLMAMYSVAKKDGQHDEWKRICNVIPEVKEHLVNDNVPEDKCAQVYKLFVESTWFNTLQDTTVNSYDRYKKKKDLNFGYINTVVGEKRMRTKLDMNEQETTTTTSE